MRTVKDYINELPKAEPLSLHFVETIEYEQDVPFLKITAIKAIKKFNYKLLVEEVYKANIEESFVKNLFFSRICGYRPFFKEERCKKNAIQGYYYEHKWAKCSDNWVPHMSNIIKLYTKKEFEEAFKVYAPYLTIDYRTFDGEDLLDYIRRFMKETKIELLAKNGLGYLYKDSRIFKLKDERLKAFILWCRLNARYISNHKPNYPYISRCIKAGMTGEQMQEYEVYFAIQKVLKQFHYSLEDCKEIKKYLDHQYGGPTFYRDYLVMSKANHRDISNRGVRFPRDFMRQHDTMAASYTKNKNRKLNSQIKEVYRELKKMQLVDEKNKLQIVIPRSQEDLVTLGNALNNCVGTAGYGMRVAKKECIILGIFKDGKPLECGELVFTKRSSVKLNQLRGSHNQPSKEHSEVKKLVNKFIRNYRSSSMMTVGA